MKNSNCFLVKPILVLLGFFVIVATGIFPRVQQCVEPSHSRCIFIDPENGSDGPSCLTLNNSNTSCKSLNYVLNEAHHSDNTVYVLSNGTHNLNTSVAEFKGLQYVTFIGMGPQDTTVQCTESDIGFKFEEVTNLDFSYLSFLHCSASRMSTSRNYSEDGTGLRFMDINVALYFLSCENVSMNNITVSNSPNGTGVVMYNTNGTNIIKNSLFSHNTVADHEHAKHGGGGGFYVELTYCIPGDQNCLNNVTSYTNRNQNLRLTFDNCIFESNIGRSSSTSNATYLVPYRSNHNAFGRGGGLSIFLKANASDNTIFINNCRFSNNSATWGGGLFVEFHDDTSNNLVLVEGSELVTNHCPFTSENGTGGGGMRLGHYVFNGDNTTVSNRIVITDSNFSNNAALNGGGLSISPTVQNVDQTQVATVVINQTTFKRNIARLGAGLHVSRFAMILDGNIIDISLIDCAFEENSNDYIDYLYKLYGTKITAYQPGLGAMYVNQVPVTFRSDQSAINFYANDGSALVAIGAALDFSDCNVIFFLNQGMNGGAIALLGLAWLRINDNSALNFVGNLATINGGAIYNKYIEHENLITYVNCFIRHTDYYSKTPSEWTATFKFASNFDQSGARISAIFSTSILPCAWGGGDLGSLHQVFCWNSSHWIYKPEQHCVKNIHSDIGNVTFTGLSRSNRVKAFPGRTFTIPISIVNDLNISLENKDVFSMTLNDYQNSTNKHNGTTKSVEYIWNLTTKVSEQSENYYHLHNHTLLLLDSIGDRAWHIVIDVELEQCPPGFFYHNMTSGCWCSNGNYSEAVSCDQDFQHAYLSSGNWMGKNENGYGYVVAICPPHYCLSGEKLKLPNSTDNLDFLICGPNNRTGTLCGSCISDHAVAVNSPRYICVNCSVDDVALNTFIYIISVYAPLTLLFSLIILFNIRLTSAPANAFILFSQLLASTFDLNADEQITFSSSAANTFIATYKKIYGIFNLEFIEQFLQPFCVGNLNTLEVISLDYAVAVFPLLMIVVIIILYKMKRRCRCIRCPTPNCCTQFIAKIQSRRTGINEAIIPAFAAFFLLSYNKFSMTSSFLVGSQPLIMRDGSPAQGNDSLRVYYNGNFSFSDPEYRRSYILPASVVFATFVAIPPILLLDLPIKVLEMCLARVPFLWRFYPVDKIHILLDTFQGCFKNKMRLFAGLYFLFRLAVNTSYNLTNDWFTQFMVQEILCLVMIALLVLCQPYNKENKLFNFVDPLIFVNLATLNAISFYLLALIRTKMTPGMHLFIFQCILILVPLLFMTIYITWYLTKSWFRHFLQKLKEVLKRRETAYQILRGIASAASSKTEQDLSSGSESDTALSEENDFFRRAEKKNTYRSKYTSTVVGIDGIEGEATTTPESTDSGLRSVQTSSGSNYGSTGNTTHNRSTINSTS